MQHTSCIRSSICYVSNIFPVMTEVEGNCMWDDRLIEYCHEIIASIPYI